MCYLVYSNQMLHLVTWLEYLDKTASYTVPPDHKGNFFAYKIPSLNDHISFLKITHTPSLLFHSLAIYSHRFTRDNTRIWLPLQAEVANREGNTPLHYACQYCPAGKTFTVNKLLQQNCNVLVSNMAGDSPFDLAVRFNKIGENEKFPR